MDERFLNPPFFLLQYRTPRMKKWRYAECGPMLTVGELNARADRLERILPRGTRFQTVLIDRAENSCQTHPKRLNLTL
jgi:hypothetical protein